MHFFFLRLWQLSLVLLLSALGLQAEQRVWTAVDGRTIDAEYLGRAQDGDALVLLRADTKTRVTVALAWLSTPDREFAEKLHRNPAPPAVQSQATVKAAGAGISEEVRALCRTLPRQTVPSDYLGVWDVNRPECVQMYDAYSRLIGAIPSGNPAANVRAVRVRLERDFRDSIPLAATSTGSGRAAACNMYWLQGVVIPLLDAIEGELSK
jgi:hypothetical protein